MRLDGITSAQFSKVVSFKTIIADRVRVPVSQVRIDKRWQPTESASTYIAYTICTNTTHEAADATSHMLNVFLRDQTAAGFLQVLNSSLQESALTVNKVVVVVEAAAGDEAMPSIPGSEKDGFEQSAAGLVVAVVLCSVVVVVGFWHCRRMHAGGKTETVSHVALDERSDIERDAIPAMRKQSSRVQYEPVCI